MLTPFRIAVPDADLRDLRDRLTRTRLNDFDQYRIDIDGLGIHFIHARSPRPDALPLVITHGWQLYWLPGNGAARLYWESFKRIQRLFTGSTTDVVRVPTGCSIFPKENPRPSRRWAAKRFLDIRYWNELNKGGHFAAFEQPELFVSEVRSFFRLVR